MINVSISDEYNNLILNSYIYVRVQQIPRQVHILV